MPQISFSSLFSFAVSKALAVAERVLDNFIDDAVPRNSGSQPPTGGMDVSRASIEDVMQLTIDRLTEVANASRDAIINKIESDKLEELLSRVQNLAFLIRVGKVSEALTYVLTVKESVDYAQNRLREGKKEWLGPSIIGKSTVVAALAHLKIDSAAEAAALAELCKRARHELLDQVVQQMASAGQPIPWDKVHAFLGGGASEAFLHVPGLSDVPADASGDRPGELTVRLAVPNQENVEVISVHVKPGDDARVDAPMIDWESDKAAFELPAPANGVVKHVLVKAGDRIKTGDAIAVLQLH